VGKTTGRRGNAIRENRAQGKKKLVNQGKRSKKIGGPPLWAGERKKKRPALYNGKERSAKRQEREGKGGKMLPWHRSRKALCQTENARNGKKKGTYLHRAQDTKGVVTSGTARGSKKKMGRGEIRRVPHYGSQTIKFVLGGDVVTNRHRRPSSQSMPASCGENLKGGCPNMSKKRNFQHRICHKLLVLGRKRGSLGLEA